jgi:hypothetical protein
VTQPIRREPLHLGMTRARVFLAGLAGLTLAAVSMFASCEKRPTAYSQATPDDVVASARAMLKAGETARFHELIYAEDDLERAFLVRVGKLMAHMQELAQEIQTRFPEDMAKLAKEAEAKAKEAAKRGSATGAGAMVNQLVTAGRQVSREQREAIAQDLITQVFADPYGWIEDQSGRLTTELVNDDQAALLLDGKAILPPVGLSMRLVGEKWYIVPPLNLPFISRYRPRTKSEWNMWASLVKIFDNAIIELRDEVRRGEVAGFSDVSRKAGEKIFMPAALAFVAVSKHYEKKFKAAQAAKAAAPAAPTGPKPAPPVPVPAR